MGIYNISKRKSRKFFEKRNKGWLNNRRYDTAFGAFLDDELVGVVTFRRSGRLVGLLVDEDHRRKGVGSALVKKALDEISAEKVSAETNGPARKTIRSLPDEYSSRVRHQDWYH